jgi:uncharacterized protein YndB with AHSA1/START domain
MTDRIEQDILIQASPARVFDLVSVPGWFIGEGDRSVQTRSRERDLDVLEDPRYGRFTFRTKANESRRHLAIRCGYAKPGEPLKDPNDEPTTLVEFEVAERESGTLLRVIESGIEAYMPDEQERARFIEGNIAAWKRQLEYARGLAEQPTT